MKVTAYVGTDNFLHGRGANFMNVSSPGGTIFPQISGMGQAEASNHKSGEKEGGATVMSIVS